MQRLPTPPPASPFFRGSAALPLLIGHRGTRIHAPENTMEAFRWAIGAGADAVELDVRRCGSGELVVVHDPDMQRLAGAPEVVARTPLRALRALSLGDGARVPLLAEALEELRLHGLLVHVEIKAGGQDIPALCEAVAAYLGGLRADVAAGVCVSSFSGRVLSTMRGLAPAIVLASTLPKGLAAPPDDVRAETLGVHPHHHLCTPGWLSHLSAGGRFVNAWTVDDFAIARRLSADGVDGLISDDVDAIRRCL